MAVSPAHLRTLHEIARLGSFSRAADSLHLSQPAVSLHVRQLEDGLGLPLLQRMGTRAARTRAAWSPSPPPRAGGGAPAPSRPGTWRASPSSSTSGEAPSARSSRDGSGAAG